MLSDLAKDYPYTLQKRLFQTLWSPMNAFEFEGVLQPNLFCKKSINTPEENNNPLVYFSEVCALTTKIRIMP